jgi:5-methylcytosine-specific restriction enzyme subunit McrC
MLPFHEVDMIDPHSIVWSGIAYHRNNATYKMLINICYLVIKGLLLTTKNGSKKLATFLDEQRMHKLYEKFVLAYYKKHYPQFHAAPSQIDWNTDDGIIDFLPTMKTDITLMYQIFTYVKNKDVTNSGNVSGALLYAKTDEEITPNNEYMMSGNKIWVKTLDLNTHFVKIKQQLDELVEKWLQEF